MVDFLQQICRETVPFPCANNQVISVATFLGSRRRFCAVVSQCMIKGVIAVVIALFLPAARGGQRQAYTRLSGTIRMWGWFRKWRSLGNLEVKCGEV
ncbi:hypothetical protein A8A01_15220 [Ewingella americana]|nr:hypothetical protein A8A01_15220 [Ewingella americana]